MRPDPCFNLLFHLLIAALVTASGCASRPSASGPASLQEAQRLETDVSADRLRQSPTRAVADLLHALELYALADDLDGQARCQLRLARIRFMQNRREEAAGHLAEAAWAANLLADTGYLYQTHLIRGRLQDSAREYERALSHAGRPIEKAVALTYLGRIDEAHAVIRGAIDTNTPQPDDYGFVLYAAAKRSRDLPTAQQALDFYKLADNPVGIADSLYLLARIHMAAQGRETARAYLQRALVVCRALGDTRRERKLIAELEAL
jgi:tetratricopeptide (TPR) repeat protein